MKRRFALASTVLIVLVFLLWFYFRNKSSNKKIYSSKQLESTKKPRDRIVRYQVLPGDNLLSIAKKFNVSVNTIRWRNKLKTNQIAVGEILEIPPVSGVVYSVKTGDTVESIAQMYHTSAKKILSFPFNDFGDVQKHTLTPGQTLYIPGGVIK